MGDNFTPFGFAGLLLAGINIESIFSIVLMTVLIVSGITSIVISIYQALKNDKKIDDDELQEINNKVNNLIDTIEKNRK